MKVHLRAVDSTTDQVPIRFVNFSKILEPELLTKTMKPSFTSCMHVDLQVGVGFVESFDT